MRITGWILALTLGMAAGSAAAADCPTQLPDHPGSWEPFTANPYAPERGTALAPAEIRLMQKKIESLLGPLKAAMPMPQGVTIRSYGDMLPVPAKASRIRAELYLLFFEWLNSRDCQPELDGEGESLHVRINQLHEPDLLLAGTKTRYYLQTAPSGHTAQGYARWDVGTERGISVSVEPKGRNPWLAVSQEEYLQAVLGVLDDTLQKVAQAGPDAISAQPLLRSRQKLQASLDGLSAPQRAAPARLNPRQMHDPLLDWQGFASPADRGARTVQKFDTDYYKDMKKRTDIRNLLIHYARADVSSTSSHMRIKALMERIDYDAYAALLDP